MIFYKRGTNILTKKNLQAIQDAENTFMNDQQFATKFCLLDAVGSCTKPMSLIRFFDGTYKYASPIFEDPGFDNIVGVLHEASK